MVVMPPISTIHLSKNRRGRMKEEMKKIITAILVAGLMLIPVVGAVSQSCFYVEKQQVKQVNVKSVIESTSTATINGRVVNKNGDGVSNVLVTVHDLECELRFHAWSNETGYFSITNVIASNNYYVRAQIPLLPIYSQEELTPYLSAGEIYTTPDLILQFHFNINSQSQPQVNPSSQNQQSNPSVQQNTKLLQNLVVRHQTTSR